MVLRIRPACLHHPHTRRGGRELLDAEQPADRIKRSRDVHLRVGVHAASDGAPVRVSLPWSGSPGRSVRRLTQGLNSDVCHHRGLLEAVDLEAGIRLRRRLGLIMVPRFGPAGVQPAHGDQAQPEVADLGQQPVQRGLVSD